MTYSRRHRLCAIAFWTSACIMALVAGRHAASQIYSGPSFDHMTVFSTNDGEALAKHFDEKFAETNGAIEAPARWNVAAKQVLLRNPLDADAMRIVALTSMASDGKLDDARKRMRLSENISARDMLGQFWLLEDAVTRENVAEVLQHYDRALSVHPTSNTLLFPVLTAALSDRSIRDELAPYVRRNRPWSYEFVGTAIDKAANTADVAALLAKAGGSRTVPRNRPLETMLLDKLVAKNQIEVARHYAEYMATDPSVRQGLDSFAFSVASTAPDLQPFSWSFVEDLILQTHFDPRDGLVVSAGSGNSGVAADRIVVLKPGKWHFRQKVEMPRLAPMAGGYWTISCMAAEGPRDILKENIPPQAGEQRLSVLFDVSDACRAVRFRLTVNGADTQEDSSITIRSVDLSRV